MARVRETTMDPTVGSSVVADLSMRSTVEATVGEAAGLVVGSSEKDPSGGGDPMPPPPPTRITAPMASSNF